MLLSNLNLLATAPGGVVRLRKLILTLAVRGKLVPQDPQDEPARELLKKIRTEKEKLIAEGKIKRGKPLPPIAEDKQPFGWQVVRLGDLIDLVSGQHLGPNEYVEGLGANVPYLTGPAEFGLVSPEPSRSTNERRALAIKADILITVKGSGVGKLNVVSHPEIAISRQLMAIRPVQMDSEFLMIVLQTMTSHFQAKSVGIAIPGIGREDVNHTLIGLPPLAEQSRIVTRVEELMRLCDALEAKGQLEATQHAQLVSTLLATLIDSETPAQLTDNWHRIATHFDLLLDRPQAVDALEQTILQLAVRGLLVPQDPQDEPASELLKKIRAEKDKLIAEGKIKRDKSLPPIAADEQPFALPQGWQWVRFDELTHPLKPIAYGVLVPGPEVKTGIPLVRIADLSLTSPATKPEKSIGPEVDAQFQRTRLEGGEILMGVVGSIGKLGVAPSTWAGANIARAICRIVPADSGLNDFVLFLLQTQFMQNSFAGDTRTLAQPTLNIGLIRAALTPVPPPAEQSRIVARVASLRGLCADLRQRLTASQSTQAHLAEALMQEVA